MGEADRGQAAFLPEVQRPALGFRPGLIEARAEAEEEGGEKEGSNQMNIDERIEALTHSVELLASFHKDVEARMEASQQANDERMGRLTDAMSKLTETMTRLGNIVISHEERIEDLEGGK